MPMYNLPPRGEQKNTEIIQTSVEIPLYEAIREFAYKNRVPIAQIVRASLAEYFAGHTDKTK